MTSDRKQHITGFTEVGFDKTLRGVGMLFGYPVEAVFVKDRLILVFTTAQTGFKIKELKKLIKEDIELNSYVEASISDGDLTVDAKLFLVTIKGINEADGESKYQQAISRLEEILKELPAYTPPEKCVICDSEGSDTLVSFDGALNLIHKICLEQHKEERMQAFEEKSYSPNTLQGVIGGVVGGIVGGIPALIALAFFDYFVGILYALIPLGIFFGWKLLGGKTTRMTTIFILIYTFVVSIGVWILSLGMAFQGIYRDFGIDITLIESIDFVFDLIVNDTDLFMEYFMTESLMALGFALLGIWFSWKRISRTDATDVSEMQETFEEAVPIE